jgi:pSer/pThr/pTyr-binding forkhead associated (FHA) protein
MGMANLSIILPSGEHRIQELNAERVSIGRVPGNTIVLPDESVSSRHAEIVQTAGNFVLRDLGAFNGTIVNDSAITEIALKEGDVVQFGSTTCVFANTPIPREPEALISAPDIGVEGEASANQSASHPKHNLEAQIAQRDRKVGWEVKATGPPTLLRHRILKAVLLVIAIGVLGSAGTIGWLYWLFKEREVTIPISSDEPITEKQAIAISREALKRLGEDTTNLRPARYDSVHSYLRSGPNGGHISWEPDRDYHGFSVDLEQHGMEVQCKVARE